MANETETQKQKQLQFPEGFLLGAGSSAHQCEGNNIHNDWWYYEQQGKLPKSGTAADHYHRYEEDFRLTKQTGLNAIRISIEWSRIEPQEGQFDKTEIEHYRQVLRTAKDLGLSTMVTLHHFTLPLWLAQTGGFFRKDSAQVFGRFAELMTREMGSLVDYWCTINEPEVYAVMGYRYGIWPPFIRDLRKWFKLHWRLIAAHKAAYYAIKKVRPNTNAGLVKNNAYYKAVHSWNPLEHLLVKFLNYTRNDFMFLRTRKEMDFLGVNYYFYHPVDLFHLSKGLNIKVKEEPKTDMGWRIYPPGLYYVLNSLRKFKKPIFITENGLADRSDSKREEFIAGHLHSVLRAISGGVDVRGYYHWALTDNFEWADGFGPRFGLIEIDYQTQQRKVRESAKILKQFK